jgi:hypothetical protein
MTPDPSLVADLHAYDSRLRIRWARHIAKWFVERKLELRNPQLVTEKPLEESASPLKRDLWESWQEGYVHVLTVPPDLAHWQFIAPELSSSDSWRAGSMGAINDALDAREAKYDADTDKRIDNWAEAATKDAYDHMGWFEGRTVSLFQAREEPAYVDTGLGFKVRDRRLSAVTYGE